MTDMTTTSQEKRPRIRPDVADKIDQQRGEIPFERFVNAALAKIQPTSYTLEPGDKRGTFRIANQDGVTGRELRPHEAHNYLEMLNLAAAAIDGLDNFQEFVTEDMDSNLTDAAEQSINGIVDLMRAVEDQVGMEHE